MLQLLQVSVHFQVSTTLCAGLVPDLCRTCAALVSDFFRNCAVLVPDFCRIWTGFVSDLCRTCAGNVPDLCRICRGLVSVMTLIIFLTPTETKLYSNRNVCRRSTRGHSVRRFRLPAVRRRLIARSIALSLAVSLGHHRPMAGGCKKRKKSELVCNAFMPKDILAHPTVIERAGDSIKSMSGPPCRKKITKNWMNSQLRSWKCRPMMNGNTEGTESFDSVGGQSS